MKKLNIILDEVTIINFPFIWKLMKRYYIITFLTPLISIFLATYFFITQNDIFLTSNTFKYISDEANSPTNTIAMLLGERTAKMSPAEIVAIMKSEDFHHSLAERIYKHKDFKKLNLNSLYAKQTKTHEELFLTCVGNKSCILDKLRAVLPEFYSIESQELVRTQFDIKIKTLDKFTCKVLLVEAKALILENRIKETKHFISEQIKISEKLIKSKKESMRNISMNDFNEKILSISKELEELSYRIRHYHGYYNHVKGNYYEVSARYKETKNTLKRGISSTKMANYKKQMRLKNERADLQKNINELKSILGTISENEKFVLKELSNKSKNLDKEIRSLSTSTTERTMGTIQNFIKSKANASDSDEYNFKVEGNRFKKIDAEYKTFMKRRREYEKELAFFQGKLEEMRPSFEYIKLLESKLIQLKLVESTVVSDLIFDDFKPTFVRYKRTSEGKISVFATVIAIFLLFTLILIRYIFDPRIYDEYELTKNFTDLKIIGHTPDFN